MSAFPRPEWDTPPDGDFASYVERLSQAHRPAAPSRSATETAATPGQVRRKPPARAGGPSSVVAAASRALTLRALRTARVVLAVLLLLQAAALFVMGWGSLVVLVFFGFLLWIVNAAASALSAGAHSKAGVAATAAPSPASLQSLLRALQQGAQQSTSRSPRK